VLNKEVVMHNVNSPNGINDTNDINPLLANLPGLVMCANAMHANVILSLFLPKAVVNDAVDCLMVQESVINFNVTSVQGYGGLLKGQSGQTTLSVKEQVAGYQDKMHLQVICQAEQTSMILTAIKASLPHTVVRYVVVPVLAMGQL
jgi:hypothetical protein